MQISIKFYGQNPGVWQPMIILYYGYFQSVKTGAPAGLSGKKIMQITKLDVSVADQGLSILSVSYYIIFIVVYGELLRLQLQLHNMHAGELQRCYKYYTLQSGRCCTQKLSI